LVLICSPLPDLDLVLLVSSPAPNVASPDHSLFIDDLQSSGCFFHLCANAEFLLIACVPLFLSLPRCTTRGSHRHKISGMGQIGNERGRGFFVQTVLAVRPQTREVLGCMAQEPFVRIPAPQGEQRHQRLKRQERETDVWMRQVQHIGMPNAGSMWVHVGDRGADMFPFFLACRANQTHFLVRAAQNRRTEACEEPI